MILSIDPSYSGFGIAIYNKDNKESKHNSRVIYYNGGCFLTSKISTPLLDKSFPGHFTAVLELLKEVENLLSLYPINTVIMEFSTPIGNYAAGLYLLDGLLLNLVINHSIKDIYCIPPNGLNSFLGKRSLTKAQIARDIQFRVGWEERINANEIHDECSAIGFILLVKDKLAGMKTPTIYKYNNSIKELFKKI